MKKKVLAIAVSAVIAGPAFAQNVSMYGVLDAGYDNIQQKTAGVKDGGKQGFSFSNHSSSRFGLKGSEDLGGGMKASFVIESNLSTNPGPRDGLEKNYYNTSRTAQGNGSTVDLTALGDRGLYAELQLSPATTLRAGFASTAIRDIVLAYDAADASNVAGNVLVSNSIFGSNRQTGLTLIQSLGSGLTGTIGVTRNNDQQVSTTTADMKTNTGYIGALQYNQGALSAGAAYQVNRSDKPALATGDRLTAGNSLVVGTAADAFKGKVTTYIAGASYTLAAAKLFAEYGQIKTSNDLGDNMKGEGDRNATSIGIQIPVGAATPFIQYSTGSINEAATSGTAASKRDWTGSSAGIKYGLSKRTYAYAVTGRQKSAAGAGGANGAEVTQAQTAVGLVHNF